MKITRTQARFSATWVTEFLIERGSVPDRPVPHSRTGAAYQVQRATMEFTARASHADPGALKLENGSGFLRTARDGLRTHSVTLAGARLKKDGTPGQARNTYLLLVNTRLLLENRLGLSKDQETGP